MTFAAVPGVVLAQVDGETVLMAPSDYRCFALKGPADRVWALLDQPRGRDEIVAALLVDYDVDPDRCRREVDDLLEDMVAAGVAVPA